MTISTQNDKGPNPYDPHPPNSQEAAAAVVGRAERGADRRHRGRRGQTALAASTRGGLRQPGPSGDMVDTTSTEHSPRSIRRFPSPHRGAIFTLF